MQRMAQHSARLLLDDPSSAVVPSFTWENELWQVGIDLVAGLDEVGRGPLAGPVVAAAVVLPVGANWPWLAEVRDSKLLSAIRRESLAICIREQAVAVAVGVAAAAYIDRFGIVAATRRAMGRALAGLPLRPQHRLVDALHLPEQAVPQTPIIHGDSLCRSIACASIVAKVARDQMMVGLDRCYPGYGLGQHKGYGTPAHLDALQRLGPSPIHRRSFAPVRDRLARERKP
jgi:ribonuclease HII